MRIILITIGTLFAVTLTLLIARFWGLGQTYSSYNHPLLERLHSGVSILRFSKIEDLKSELAKTDSDAVIMIDLSVTADGVFGARFNSKEKSLHKVTGAEWPESSLRFDELHKLLGSRCFIINVFDNVGGIHNHLNKLLQDSGISEKQCVGIWSDTESVVKSTRELLPRFVYGSSRAEFMTMLSMESMFLLPAFRIRSDLLMAPLRNLKGTLLLDSTMSKDLIEETHRQKKKFVIGPISQASNEDMETAKTLSPDAILVDR